MAKKMAGAAVLASVGALLIVAAVLAKGPPAQVRIEGPGLAAPLEFTDPETLKAFSFFQFEDLDHKIEAPAAPGEAYLITRYVQDGQTMRAWDRVIYYPGTGGQRGVVFLEGLIGESYTEFDGYWYEATGLGDRAMRGILAENLPPSAARQFQAASMRPTPVVIVALAGLLAAAWLVAGRRKTARQEA